MHRANLTEDLTSNLNLLLRLEFDGKGERLPVFDGTFATGYLQK